MVAFCALIFHFSMLLLASFSPSQHKSSWHYRAEHYSYPFFQQGWSLFAPAPDVNYKLLVAYERNGWQKQELISNCHWKHQSNLLAGREALLLALCNAAHFFEKSTAGKGSLNGPVQGDVYFDILEQQALRYINHNKHDKVNQLHMILYVNDFTRQKSRAYYNSGYVSLKR